MLKSFEAPWAVVDCFTASCNGACGCWVSISIRHLILLSAFCTESPCHCVLVFTSTCVHVERKRCLPGCRPCRQSWARLNPSGGASVGTKTQQLRQFLLLSVDLISASGRLITFQVQGPAGLLSMMHKENWEAQHTYS